MLRYCPEIFTDLQNKAIRIAFGQYRYLPVEVKKELNARGYLDDLRQELYLSGILAVRSGLKDYKEIRRFVQRRIYRFLKDYGFRKGNRSYLYRYSWGIHTNKNEEDF